MPADHSSVVGHKFKFWDTVFLCDSYDPDIGYWMTPVDATLPDPIYTKETVRRRHVSERAIGRTYHIVREHA